MFVGVSKGSGYTIPFVFGSTKRTLIVIFVCGEVGVKGKVPQGIVTKPLSAPLALCGRLAMAKGVLPFQIGTLDV